MIKKKVNFSPTEKIAQLLVSNEYVVLVMINNVLLRINLKQDNIEGKTNIFYNNMRVKTYVRGHQLKYSQIECYCLKIEI